MSIVPIKLRLNDHGEASIRRFGTDLSSFAGFVRQVLTLSTRGHHHGDSPSPIRVTITYIDDERDTVTVGSELEWQEMIRILLSQRRDSSPLLHLSAGLTTTLAHRSSSPRGLEPQPGVGTSESTAAPTSTDAPLHVRLGAILEDFSLGLADYDAVQAAFSVAEAAGPATVTVEVRVCQVRWVSLCGNVTDACALLHTLRREMDPEAFNALRLHKNFDNSRDHPNFPRAVGVVHLQQQQQQQSQRQETPVLLTFDTDDESGADAEQHNDLAVSRSFGSLAALDRMHNFMEMFPMLTQAEAIVLTNFPTDDEAVHHVLTQMPVPPQR